MAKRSGKIIKVAVICGHYGELATRNVTPSMLREMLAFERELGSRVLRIGKHRVH